MNNIAAMETTVLPALPRSYKGPLQLPAITGPTSLFPLAYIVAPEVYDCGDIFDIEICSQELAYCSLACAVYNLEMAPALVFDAWIRRSARHLSISAYTTDPRSLNIVDRWRIIDALVERGVELQLFDSIAEAQKALRRGGRS